MVEKKYGRLLELSCALTLANAYNYKGIGTQIHMSIRTSRRLTGANPIRKKNFLPPPSLALPPQPKEGTKNRI